MQINTFFGIEHHLLTILCTRLNFYCFSLQFGIPIIIDIKRRKIESEVNENRKEKKCGIFLLYLNNYFGLYVYLSFRGSVRPSVHYTLDFYLASQNVTNKSFALRVKNIHFGSTSDSQNVARQSRATYNTLLGKGKPSCVYQNSLQCFISFPVLVPSSCVHQHTQDVPAKRVLPSYINLR